MLKITTTNISDRNDWYHAYANHNGVSYHAFFSTRHEAFMDVLRRVAIKMTLSDAAPVRSV